MRALGKTESKEAEQESLLLEYEVPYRPFGRAVLDCLPVEGEGWVVGPKPDGSGGGGMTPEWKGREDLRGLNVCSIDPPSASLPFFYLYVVLVEEGRYGSVILKCGCLPRLSRYR